VVVHPAFDSCGSLCGDELFKDTGSETLWWVWEKSGGYRIK